MKIVSLLIAGVLALAACTPIPAVYSNGSDPQTISVIGDSITIGTFGLTNPGIHWWEHVATSLEVEDVSVSAYPGWASGDALRAGPPAPQADIVLIALGSNDQIVREDPVVYRQHLLTMASWGDKCVIIAPWERTGWSAGFLAPDITPLSWYSLNAYRAALDANCAFVDWREISTADPAVSVDGLHPTPYGNELLAAPVLNVVK